MWETVERHQRLRELSELRETVLRRTHDVPNEALAGGTS